jgi:hypothetical protein
MNASDLDTQIAKVTETMYAIAGTDAVRELGKALHGTAVAPAGGGGWSRGVPAAGRGEVRYRGPTDTPNRHRLIQVHERCIPALFDRVKECKRVLQEQAVVDAIAHVRRARTKALAEAKRYVEVGRDTIALYDAMARIATMRRMIDDVVAAESKAARAAQDQAKARAATYKLALLGTAADQPRAFASAPSPDPIATTRARGELARRTDATRSELAAHLDVHCHEHPVLFRLWNTETVFLAHRMFEGTDANNIVQVVRAIETAVDIRAAVAETFRKTVAAADSVIERLQDDPTAIWRYSIAIDRALHDHAAPPGSVAWRVAQDALRAANESDAANAAELAGYFALGLMLVPGAQPLAVVADVVASVLAVATLIQDLIEESRKDDAWLCALDPRDALANGAGSYAASVLLLTTLLPGLRSSLAYGLGVMAITTGMQ